MKTRTKWWLRAGLGAVALTILLAIWRRDRSQHEPVLHWTSQLPVTIPLEHPTGEIRYAEAASLSIHGVTNGMINGDPQRAASLINAMGTNALPSLLTEIRREDSRAKAPHARDTNISRGTVFPYHARYRCVTVDSGEI